MMRILFSKNRSARHAGFVLILLAALAAIVPELVRGNSCGHDFDFHLLSWMDALRAWRQGILYPHWIPDANFGAGEPRFVFYPPLTWMLGAALGTILSWTWVPTALTFLLLAATGLGVRSLAREIFGLCDRNFSSFIQTENADANASLGEGAATLAGCVAIFGGYALFTAYERCAFAELAGGLWMALLFKLALRAKSCSGGASLWRRALDGSAVPLALVIAGAWLSNPTVAVMACYTLVALAFVQAWLDRSWAPAVRAAAALPVGIGLTALYLAPVAGEQRWADLNQVNLSPGQTLENNWLFARHADPVLAYHDEVLHQVSLIAVAMVAVTLCAFAFCAWRKRLPGGRRWWLPLALVPVAVLALQFPLSHALWMLPKLRYLQFPWRWLVALEAPMGVFVAAALWPRARESRFLRWAISALACFVFAGLIFGANRWHFQECSESDSVAGMMRTYAAGAGLRGMDEYVPPGADNDLIATGLPDACLSADSGTVLGKAQPPAADASPDDDPLPPLWEPSQKSCLQVFRALPRRASRGAEHFEIAGRAERAGFMILHLRSYPAWRVQINGATISSLPKREDGLMAVPVSAGPLRLTVDWMATPDVLLGRWVSLLSVFLLTALLWIERRGRAARIE